MANIKHINIEKNWEKSLVMAAAMKK